MTEARAPLSGTQTLYGTITTGYTLAANYSALILAPSAEVIGVVGEGSGGAGGVAVYMPLATTLSNAGTIIGGAGGAGETAGVGGAGVHLAAGANGSNTAMIVGGAGGAGGAGSGRGGVGGAGVSMARGASLFNGGTIRGGAGGSGPIADGLAGAGVQLLAGGSVDNAAGGVIAGQIGVDTAAVGAVTVTNLGTIEGAAGIALRFGSSADRLVAGAGSVLLGAARGGGGTLELSAGAVDGTIVGLGLSGTVSGPESLTFSGFGAYLLDAGGTWTLAGSNSLAAGQSLNDLGTLIVAGALANAGTIVGGPGADGLVMATGAVLRNDGGGASIVGYFDGVLAATTTVATVTNFGTIRGTYLDGVQLAAGGTVVNGAPDTTRALISGAYAGVYALSGPTTVTNFGAIVGARGEGVELGAGGAVHNGRSTVTAALISGYFDGVYAYGAAASVTNFGTILGSEGAGVLLTAGGVVINGSAAAPTALISGSDVGVYAFDPTVAVTNFATIIGTGSAGVELAHGGVVINGGPGATRALISGGIGVYVDTERATVTNFGTIQGDEGVAVRFASFRDRLIDEAGAVFLGAVQGAGGTLELAAGGPGTISGLGSAMTGFGAYVVEADAAWTLGGANTLTAGARLVVAGALTVSDEASLALQGMIVDSGSITLAGAAGATRLIVGAAGATLSGGGQLVLGESALDRVVGATPDARLVNIDGTIEGGGLLGNGSLALVNRAAGVIDQTGAAALVIDTGAAGFVNAGVIEATGPGGATITRAVDNTGTLEALGGTLAVGGAVTGTGSAIIDGGALRFAATFIQNVDFGREGGVLSLARSQGYTGTITGFSRTGATVLDLRDIAFVGAGEATFSGTRTGGVLTVSDGTHTAKIALAGDYVGGSWMVASDGAGGVLVTDSGGQPRLDATRPSPLAFVAAMAGVPARGPGQAAAAMHEGRESPPMMLSPRG